MRRGQAGLLAKNCEYLRPSDKLVFLALLERADNETCVVPYKMAPTFATLAAWTSLSHRTVRRTVAHLEKHGWATVTRGDGRGIKSKYALVQRDPDSSCDCERVSRCHPLRPRKGVTVTPFETGKGVTDDTKGGHERPERGTLGSESSQVNDGIAYRDKRGHVRGSVTGAPTRCDFCTSTDTQLNMGSGYRLCREHAGPTWKERSA